MRLIEAFNSASSVLATARAVHMISCGVLASVFVFEQLIARRCGAVPRRAMLIWPSILIMLLSGAVWFGAVMVDMIGLPPSECLTRANIQMVLAHCDFGKLWVFRFAVVIATAVAWQIIRISGRGNRAHAMLLGSLVLLGSLAWAGHGSFGDRPNTHLAADVVHLMIIAIWPAGLAPLWLMLGTFDSVDRLIPIVDRFSNFALVSVLVLVGTGWINSWMLVASWRALIDSPYGQMLLLKLLLVLLMVAIGAVNLLCMRPRIARSLAAMTWLRWNVATEMLLTIGVMLAVGYLGLLQPAAEL